MSAATRAPHAGLRVIEWADNPAGELLGRLLAQMGAEVTKLEPPQGAPSRSLPPHAPGGGSLSFCFYNAGKNSTVVDLDSGGAIDQIEPQLAEADVFITTVDPGGLVERGIDLRSLVDSHPRLVVVSITPFGLDGPWSTYQSSDLVGLAAGGFLNSCGYDDHSLPPMRPGGDQGYNTAAAFAHIGTLLALIDRDQSGQGQLIDVSMHESIAVTVEMANPYWTYNQSLVQRQTCRHAQPEISPSYIFDTADGRYIYFGWNTTAYDRWEELVAWLDRHGHAGSLTDEAFRSRDHRDRNIDAIESTVARFMGTYEAEWLYRDGQAHGLPIGVLNTPDDLLVDPHLVQRGAFQAVDQPGIGQVLLPAPPYRFSSWAPPPQGPAPALDEPNRGVTNAGGWS